MTMTGFNLFHLLHEMLSQSNVGDTKGHDTQLWDVALKSQCTEVSLAAIDYLNSCYMSGECTQCAEVSMHQSLCLWYFHYSVLTFLGHSLHIYLLGENETTVVYVFINDFYVMNTSSVQKSYLYTIVSSSTCLELFLLQTMICPESQSLWIAV